MFVSIFSGKGKDTFSWTQHDIIRFLTMFGPTGTEQLILSSCIVSAVAIDESSNDHEDVNSNSL